MTNRKVEFRTKKQALQQVASHTAGLLGAGSFEEATGRDPNEMGTAERERLHWAIDEIQGRLYRIGGKESRSQLPPGG